MLSTNLMEYAPQNERITQKSITSSFTPKRKPEDSYMKKNKKETKIHYIIPQHRAHLLQLSEKYTENDKSPKIEVKTKEKQRPFDQTLVYFRALSNPQSNPT